MKILIALLFLCVGVPSVTTAQSRRPGFPSGSSASAGPWLTAPQQPWLALRAGRNTGSSASAIGGAWPSWGNPAQFGDSCLSDSEPYASPGQMMTPEPEPPLPTPIDRPARPVIHEYSWVGAPTSSGALFSIVLKDGEVRRAAAVWIADDGLHYAGAGGGGKLSMAAMDLESTRRLNAQAGLIWPIAGR